ncbi:hypothetical protein GBA52_008123 [Prunus armeniaca]|nr:hypothetical protein GBA52_008123 [Prunus armeniaca]
MTAVDLETIGTIAGADPLISPYQGNHQKRRCIDEQENDKINTLDMRETTTRLTPQSRSKE